MSAKRILSLILVFAMLASLIVVNVVDVAASTSDTDANGDPVSVWGGPTDVSDHLEGAGTAEKPYLIQSAADLAYLAQVINDTDRTVIYNKDSGWYRKAYIVQTVNIDLGKHEWTPIGTDCDYGTFCGVYDGRGHYIKNMKIAEVHGLSHGLFGYLGDSGSQVTLSKGEYCGITNLTVEGEITAANNRVGGLVGQIHNRGHVVEGTTAYITNVTCNVKINIDGTNGGKGANIGSDVDNKYYFGGVVGISNFAVLENVVNNGEVSIKNCDSSHPVGGIIGRATRTILKDCVNIGKVTLETNRLNTQWNPGEETPKFDQDLSGTLRAGGIVGQYIKIANDDYLTFENCINKGDVLAKENGSNERVHAGGILGSLTYLDSMKTTEDGTKYSDYNLTFTNCANTGAITAERTGTSGETNAGGILGTTYHGKGGAETNAGGITIQGCANTGTIESNPNTANAGGITGVVHVKDTHDLLVIENCISNTTVTNFVTAPPEVEAAINSGTTVDATKANNLAAANEALCMPSVTEICGFPTWGMAGLGSAESPFRISNFKELKAFANLVNSSKGNREKRFENVYVKQTADITISGAWTPIGKDPACSFLGVYDGDDKTISGLSNFADNLTSIGLFGYIGNADGNTDLNHQCGIANLTVNGTIKQSAQYVGGVVGKINHENYVADENIAYIINTTSNVAINFSGYTSDADANWGGVAGYASSTIFQHVENKGTISISGNIDCGVNKISLGGIAGRAEHFDMVGCKNASTGDISFTTTSNTATGEIYIGGLLGLIYKKDLVQEQRFTECVNEGDVRGTRYTDNWFFVGGIVGGPFWGMVDSSNPTFKYTDDQGKEVVTSKKYRDYNTRFVGCVNSGAISATISSDTDKNSSNMNAAGILGSTYLPGSQGQNNGGIKFEMCANKASVTASNPTRAAGITQALYTTNDYNYGLRLKGCATSANAGEGKFLVKGNVLGNQGDQEDGYDSNGQGSDTTVANLVERAEAFYLLSGYNINGFPTGRQNPSSTNKYTSAFLMGTGTNKDPFVINNAADLRCFRDLSNGGTKKAATNFKGSYIIQTADITLGGENEPWEPISKIDTNAFAGVYDGQGHTISGLYINGKDDEGANLSGAYSYGLFGYIGNTETRQVCGVANLTVEGSIVKGNNRVGGLAGQINSRYSATTPFVYITNVVCAVDITITDYITAVGGGNTGTEHDNRHCFGGVVGISNSAVFENVVNEGSVTVHGAFADHPVGGIVGRAANTEFVSCTNSGAVDVNTSFWTADVTYDNVTNTVIGIARAGGIVGLYLKRVANEWIVFKNCVNEAPVSAAVSVAGTGRVHAGGILGSIRYPLDDNDMPTYDGNKYTPYDISIVNSTNIGAVSATNQGSGETNAGGIIGTLYDGFGGQPKNAGDITVKECVNVGGVSADRAAGIAGCVYNEGECDYGVKIIGCMTKAGLGGSGSNIAHQVYKDSCKYDGTDSAGGSSLYDELQAWNTSLMAPSLENINGMPTAANVVVIRGLENITLDLGEGETRDVGIYETIIDESGKRVEKLDKPGKYRYVLRYIGATPYVSDVVELYYSVTYDKAFADEVNISIKIQDDKLEKIFGTIKINNKNATPLNSYTSYGKTGACVGGMIHVPRILPQQFAEPIYTTVSYNGNEVYAHEYTLWEYAHKMLNEETASSLGMTEAKKAAFDNLLVDLYKYAEEAQKLRWFPEEKYVTKYLTTAQKALGSKIESISAELTGRILSLTYDGLYTDDGGIYEYGKEPVIWRGAKLSFDHSIVMRIELAKAPENRAEIYEVTATIGGEEAECGFEDTYVYIKGFSPLRYDDEVVINVYDKEGNKVAATVHYSVNTYLFNRWSADVYSPLVQSLACYSKSACAFVNAN